MMGKVPRKPPISYFLPPTWLSIYRDSIAFHQLKEFLPAEEKDELVVAAVLHVNGNRRKDRGFVTTDIGDICILHFQVPVFGRDCQFAGLVGDSLIIRNDLAAKQTAVAEAYDKQLFLHDIFLQVRRKPLFCCIQHMTAGSRETGIKEKNRQAYFITERRIE